MKFTSSRLTPLLLIVAPLHPVFAQQEVDKKTDTSIGATSAQPTSLAKKESSPSLPDDATMKVLVNVEARRLPLHSVLQELTRQSQVALALQPGAFKDVLVTARLKAMPLRNAMQLLSQLYQAKWIRNGAGHYELQPPVDADERDILVLGDGYAPWLQPLSGNPAVKQQERQERVDLAQEVMEEAGEAVKSPQGQAISELSEDLQKRLKERFISDANYELVKAYRRFLIGTHPDSKVALTIQKAGFSTPGGTRLEWSVAVVSPQPGLNYRILLPGPLVENLENLPQPPTPDILVAPTVVSR